MNQLTVTIEEPFTNNGKEYDVIIKAEVSVNCIPGEDNEMYHQGCPPEIELYMIHDLKVSFSNVDEENSEGGGVILEMIRLDAFSIISEHIAENESEYFEIIKEN